jgi:hypothetical protein
MTTAAPAKKPRVKRPEPEPAKPAERVIFDPTLPPPLNTMTREEADAYVDELDKPIEFEDTLPPTPEQKDQLRRAGFKFEEDEVGAVYLQLPLERGVLRQLDAHAQQHGLDRSQVVSLALRRYLPQPSVKPAGDSAD